MEQEVGHGEKAVYAGVQAGGCAADQAARRFVCAGVGRSWSSSDTITQLGEAVRGRSAACISRPRPDEAGTVRDCAAQARGCQTEGRAGHPKKSRGLLREGIDVRFGFVAKHRGIWLAE